MIIDEKIKNDLLHWNDTEPVYQQFQKKCNILSELSNLEIIPEAYQLQYELHVAEMNTYVDLQTEIYEMLYNKYPMLEFGMSGRLKSPFSHYEKIIRKFVDLFEKDEFKVVEILDDYAMKIYIYSVNYNISKVSVDSEGIYIDSGADEFRITDNDVFEFEDEKGRTLNISVEKDQSNIWVQNSVPHIYTVVNDKEIILPLTAAKTYKRSNENDLIPYCTDVQKDTELFLNSKKFSTRKRKNYIANPKQSGYKSLQCSFYSEELDLGIECQIRTKDMEDASTLERATGYKPEEKKITANSLNKVSRFALTTRFKDTGVQTYTMNDDECFEYLFGMPLSDYRKQMKPKLTFRSEEEKRPEGDSR